MNALDCLASATRLAPAVRRAAALVCAMALGLSACAKGGTPPPYGIDTLREALTEGHAYTIRVTEGDRPPYEVAYTIAEVRRGGFELRRQLGPKAPRTGRRTTWRRHLRDLRMPEATRTGEERLVTPMGEATCARFAAADPSGTRAWWHCPDWPGVPTRFELEPAMGSRVVVEVIAWGAGAGELANPAAPTNAQPTPETEDPTPPPNAPTPSDPEDPTTTPASVRPYTREEVVAAMVPGHSFVLRTVEPGAPTRDVRWTVLDADDTGLSLQAASATGHTETQRVTWTEWLATVPSGEPLFLAADTAEGPSGLVRCTKSVWPIGADAIGRPMVQSFCLSADFPGVAVATTVEVAAQEHARVMLVAWEPPAAGSEEAATAPLPTGPARAE